MSKEENKIVAYIYQVRSQVEALGDVASFAFACACLERLFPVYERAAAGKSWDRSHDLRVALNHIWDLLDGTLNFPSALDRKKCKEARLEEGITDNEMTVASFVASSFYTFARGIRRYNLHVSSTRAQSNIDFLCFFLDNLLGCRNSTNEDDKVVFSHELMQQEIKRQQEDLVFVSSVPEVTDEMVHQLRDLRKGQCLIGDYWVSQWK